MDTNSTSLLCWLYPTAPPSTWTFLSPKACRPGDPGDRHPEVLLTWKCPPLAFLHVSSYASPGPCSHRGVWCCVRYAWAGFGGIGGHITHVSPTRPDAASPQDATGTRKRTNAWRRWWSGCVPLFTALPGAGSWQNWTTERAAGYSCRHLLPPAVALHGGMLATESAPTPRQLPPVWRRHLWHWGQAGSWMLLQGRKLLCVPTTPLAQGRDPQLEQATLSSLVTQRLVPPHAASPHSTASPLAVQRVLPSLGFRVNTELKGSCSSPSPGRDGTVVHLFKLELGPFLAEPVAPC